MQGMPEIDRNFALTRRSLPVVASVLSMYVAQSILTPAPIYRETRRVQGRPTDIVGA